MEKVIIREENLISIRTKSENYDITIEYRKPSINFDIMISKTDDEIRNELIELEKQKQNV